MENRFSIPSYGIVLLNHLIAMDISSLEAVGALLAVSLSIG